MNTVGAGLNTVGSEVNYVNNQISYNSDKIDALNTGLGSLVDADLAKESAALQALQIRQQLGTQALSIANQAPQTLLSLFKYTETNHRSRPGESLAGDGVRCCPARRR